MINEPTKVELAVIPKFHTTEEQPSEEQVAYMHFFVGECDWYITEWDAIDQMFYGCYFLRGRFEMSEWGHISFIWLKKLLVGKSAVQVNRDTSWRAMKISEIQDIRTATAAMQIKTTFRSIR